MDKPNFWRLVCAAALLVASLGAAAEEQVCVALNTAAQLEQQYVDLDGVARQRLVPPEKVVPGDLIVWTITATNSCAGPAEVVIENAVPEHMTFVADSATGTGMAITYSLDGSAFANLEDLLVREADGTSRPARPDEIGAIRWLVSEPIGSGAAATAVYRAHVD